LYKKQQHAQKHRKLLRFSAEKMLIVMGKEKDIK